MTGSDGAPRVPNPARFEAGARIILGRIAPHLAGLPLRRQVTLPTSLVYAVGPDHFLRMALVRDLALAILREAAILERLREALPVAIPRLVALSREPAAMVIERVPGVPPIAVERMPEAALQRLVEGLATFLASLHGQRQDGMGHSAALSIASQHALLATAYAQVAGTLAAPTRAYIEDALAELQGLREAEDLVVVHGDLHADNVLMEPGTGRLTGVIDFTLCGLADRHVDLMRFARASDRLSAGVAQRYAALTGHALDRVRLRVLCRSMLCRQVVLERDLPMAIAAAEKQMAAGAYTAAQPGAVAP